MIADSCLAGGRSAGSATDPADFAPDSFVYAGWARCRYLVLRGAPAGSGRIQHRCSNRRSANTTGCKWIRLLIDPILNHPIKAISAFVCVLLVIGYVNRTKKKLHISMMLSALAIDLGIVLYLELTRQVVESVATRDMSPLLIFHICLSTVVLILYGVQVYTGIKNVKGKRSTVHPKTAIIFLITRFGNLITSYLVT